MGSMGQDGSCCPAVWETTNMKTKIIRNSAKCLGCNTEAVSSYRWDAQTCRCNNVFVDGGTDYIRRAVKDLNLYEDTSIILSASEDDPCREH